MLGGLGFAAYGAANHFMDAFAQQQSRSATFPWLSVNWDGWRFQPEAHQGLGQTMADLALTPAEGSAVWQRLLAYAVAPQIIVSTGDLSLRQQQWQSSSAPSNLSNPVGDIRPVSNRPALTGDYQAPRNSVENTVAEIWQSFLGISPIGVDDSFFELGGHSLLATQIMVHLRQQFQVDIPLRCLFDTPTVAGLAQAIAHQQGETSLVTDAVAQGQPFAIAALPRFQPAEIQQLLDQIDHLPESEVDDLLHQFSQLQVLT